MMPHPAARTRFSDWPLAVKSILGFWLFYALTVVARAFLGTDPWTTLENKLVVIGIGIVAYASDLPRHRGLRRRGASIRRKAIIAGVASIIGALAMGGTLILIEDLIPREQEEFRFQAREGFTVVEQGQQIVIERTAQEPLRADLARRFASSIR